MKEKLDVERISVGSIGYEDKEDLVDDPDKIIIKEENIRIVFDFPVRYTTYIDFHSKGGFTQYHLFKCIYNGYIELLEADMITHHSFDDLLIEKIYYDKIEGICHPLVTS